MGGYSKTNAGGIREVCAVGHLTEACVRIKVRASLRALLRGGGVTHIRSIAADVEQRHTYLIE